MGFVGVFGAVGAASDKHQALAVDDAEAGAWAIGKVFVFGHINLVMPGTVPGIHALLSK